MNLGIKLHVFYIMCLGVCLFIGNMLPYHESHYNM